MTRTRVDGGESCAEVVVDPTKLARQLDQKGWSKRALKATLAALARPGGGLEPVAVEALARAALGRGEQGHGKDAAVLAALTLNAAPAPAIDQDDESALVAQDTLRWARYRLRLVLRTYHSKAALQLLEPEQLAALGPSDVALDPATLIAVADDPKAVAEAVVRDLSAATEESLADGLVSLQQAAREMMAQGQHAGACGACRAALDLEENARMTSGIGRAVLAELGDALRSILVESLGSLAADDPVRRETLKWLLKTKGGEVRIGREGFPVSALATRDLDEVVTRLRRSAVRSAAARQALLTLGQGVLGEEEYLALCHELGHARGVVTTLLDRGDIDGAARHARAAIAQDESEWQLAELFHQHQRTDLAIAMLRDVAEDTINSKLELWLADQLEAQGAGDEVLALYRRRFTKRPALPQYQALRQRADKRRWRQLRQELLDELRERRLYRPLVDIAAHEQDAALLSSLAAELDDHQAEHAQQVVRSWLAGSERPQPAVQKVLRQLDRQTDRGEAAIREVPVASPVPKRVRHKTFGEGDVVSWSGEEDQRKLEIEFDKVGRKVLLARFVEEVP